MNSLQPAIVNKGKEIFSRMEGHTPRIFSQKNLAGRLLRWSMRNPELKTRLFQLVDVLPSLTSASDIAQHAKDYLDREDGALPKIVRWGLRQSSAFPWLTSAAARQSVFQIAKSFVIARAAEEAIPSLRAMRDLPLAFTIDILGETALSESEAKQYQIRYLQLVETLAREAAHWPAGRQIDCDDRGPIPVVNISIKISSLYSQLNPADPQTAIEQLSARLLPILQRAKELGVFINLDMEQSALKEITFTLFKSLLDHPTLTDYRHAGIALQAYLVDSAQDLEDLIAWARQRGAPVTIRLIKGAYWDYETVLAHQQNWPVPVFQHKPETDANFERLAARILQCPDAVRPAFGTHSVRSIAACLAHAENLGRPLDSLEFQMLYGMAEPIKMALIQLGCRVRDYCPVGEILPGMSYLVRRLLENTSNEGFLRATFTENLSPEQLLEDPAEFQPPSAEPAAIHSSGISFANTPHTDFSKAAHRQAMKAAVAKVQCRLGRSYPLVISHKTIHTRELILSTNPARPDEIVGRVSKAAPAEAEVAITNARLAFLSWRRTPVEERAQLLERAAQLMQEERFDLAALEIFETGKNWLESDADVAEATDFCRFYAGEMRRLAEEIHHVPGESNLHQHIPRGLCAVIAPWNFPLAILTGMTAAAVVAGNCVLMKPSEQSPVTAAWLMDIFRRAGVPPGVINFLPGQGEELGAYLVNHPSIDIIAFTGSREVGLSIYAAAGQTRPGQSNLKKVICEMGGKNALILDSDADLDEAIPAIVQSAFGYQGQKCSALSRLIVLNDIYPRALSRLIEAVSSLRIGYPEDPVATFGPVIDSAAYQRILQYIETGKKEAELAFQGRLDFETHGYFVPPVIFKNVPPNARIAQEEIFGPVLSVIPAQDLNEALEIANNTAYALTGGLFSRNPRHIEKVKAEFLAGNLYINRGITGALVDRHPFGGFKMSGGGTKAGGREYLQHFLFPRVITENLLRRGFTAEDQRPKTKD